MQIAFIRHAEAVDAGEFPGADEDRPLTSKGWKTARKAFARLPHVLDEPFCILHSAARRAAETAAIVAEVYPRALKREEKALNPGAHAATIRRLVRSQERRRGCLVVVGHEPDLSEAIADLAGARCRLKKAAVAVLDAEEPCRLEALLGPDVLQAMKKTPQ